MDVLTRFCQELYFCMLRLWTFLDGKKTAIGAVFFVVKDVVVVPYFTRFQGGMPPQLDFWMGVVATLFTLAGVTHQVTKGIQSRRLARATALQSVSRN